MKKIFIAVLGALIFSPIILPQNNFIPAQKVFAKENLTAEQLAEKASDCNKAGDYKKAAEYAKKALKLNPKHDWARINLGYAYFALGEYDNAVENFKKAVEINPDNAANWNRARRTL